jgi:ribosome-associated protein
MSGMSKKPAKKATVGRKPRVGKKAVPGASAAAKRASDAKTRKFAVESARLLADLHAEDVQLFDVRKISDVTDYILIGTGTSDRQIRALGDRVEELGVAMGFERYGRDADSRATWIVVDFVGVVVHLFDPAARAHYDLEMLWGDAPKVKWHRSLSSPIPMST